MPNLIRTCKWCLTTFETEWETKVYCTRAHKEAAKKYRNNDRKFSRIYSFICKTCESPCVSKVKTQIYCSVECSNWLRVEQRREKEKVRAKGLKAKLYFRDNGKCQFCFESIDIALNYPDPLSLSIDHILPRSKGGYSTIENLQIAHLSCNVRAGAKN